MQRALSEGAMSEVSSNTQGGPGPAHSSVLRPLGGGGGSGKSIWDSGGRQTQGIFLCSPWGPGALPHSRPPGTHSPASCQPCMTSALTPRSHPITCPKSQPGLPAWQLSPTGRPPSSAEHRAPVSHHPALVQASPEWLPFHGREPGQVHSGQPCSHQCGRHPGAAPTEGPGPQGQ